VTVTGGKWTTYRAMAEDVLRRCADKGLLSSRPAGKTVHLSLVGAPPPGSAAPIAISQAEGAHSYGTEAACFQQLPGVDTVLAGGLTEAMVRFAARHEYAMTVEDMLARRSRWLFLDARVAASLAPRVAEILREETGGDPQLADFLRLTAQYLKIP